MDEWGEGYEAGYYEGRDSVESDVYVLRKALTQAINALNQVPDLTVTQANAALDAALDALEMTSDRE